MPHGDYFARLIEHGKAAIFPFTANPEEPMSPYTPERALTTQIAYPWQATVRTVFAVAIAALLVGGVVWALYAGIGVQANIETIVSLIILVAGAVTRVMAHPDVNDALGILFNLATIPNGADNEA